MRRVHEYKLRRVFAYLGPLEIKSVDWAEWVTGDSPGRLTKISNRLYAQKGGLEKKQERDNNQAAIIHYDRGLEFLKSTCYYGDFSCTWPD